MEKKKRKKNRNKILKKKKKGKQFFFGGGGGAQKINCGFPLFSRRVLKHNPNKKRGISLYDKNMTIE